MASQAVTSGNERKSRITVLGAGNISANSPVKDLTHNANNTDPTRVNKTIFLANGNSANNVGASGIYASREFNNTRKGEYVMPLVTSKIAGTTDTTMRSPGADFGQGQDPRSYGYTRQSISSWDYVTGAATKTANDGVQVLASGIGGQTGKGADQAWGTDAIPHEIVFLVTGKTPTQADLEARHG